MLLIFGVVFGWIVVALLPLVGLPGVLIAGQPGKRSKFRLTTGVGAAALCQTYFYLAYVAFIIGWTHAQIDRESISRYFVWVFAFLSSVLPIWIGAATMKVHHKNKSTGYADVTVEASYLTGVIAFIGFFVFSFVPKATSLWAWIPYVGE